MRQSIVILLAAAFAVAPPLKAGAQTPVPPAAAPSRTTATYGDWVMRCETATLDGKDVKACESAQAISAPNGQGAIAQIVIGRPAGEAQDRVVVELPAGIWLPGNATIRIDESTDLSLDFKRCLQSCLADRVLTDTERKSLVSATAITLSFQDGAQKPIRLSASTKGLTEAYTASLAK